MLIKRGKGGGGLLAPLPEPPKMRIVASGMRFKIAQKVPPKECYF